MLAMSNLPAFAQGVQFSMETSRDNEDLLPSFHPHAPRPPQGHHLNEHSGRGSRFQSRGHTSSPRGGYASREHFSQGNFSSRGGGHSGLGASHNAPPQRFYERCHGTAWSDRQSSAQSFTPRGGQNPYRGGGYRGQQQRPIYTNPYEQQLTPRQNYGPRQRWTHTPRGRPRASGDFGPCAKGATQETLAVIDAFVKPSMFDDPWKRLEEERSQRAAEKSNLETPSPKRGRSEIEPDRSPPPDEDEEEDQPGSSSQTGNVDDTKDDFNIKEFIPKL